MMHNLEALVEISRKYGSDSDFVIAGGGNTSYKNADYLWIKASGIALETITVEGFVKMDRHGLDELSTGRYSSDPVEREAQVREALNRCIADDRGKRPSVETSLHNLLEFPFVVHTHPTLVNALMCSVNSRETTEEMFGDEALFVEYTDPGFVLFRKVDERIKEYMAATGHAPEIIFLENHGVFVSALSANEIDRIYNLISRKLEGAVTTPLPSRAPEDPYLNAYVRELTDKLGLSAREYSSRLIHYFVKDNESFSKVSTAFTPDQIVYCKAHYLFSEDGAEELPGACRAFEARHGYLPKVVGVRNRGIICLEENDRAVQTVFEVFNDMLKIAFLAESFGGPKAMTEEQIAFIDQWEVENYRRKIAKQ